MKTMLFSKYKCVTIKKTSKLNFSILKTHWDCIIKISSLNPVVFSLTSLIHLLILFEKKYIYNAVN